MGEKIDSVIRFFLYVLIFWLPYSPAVIETCVIICLILWILKRIVVRKQRPIIQKTVLNKPFLTFGAISLLSALTSVFWQESLSNFLTKTLEWFIVCFLVIEAVTERRHIFLILIIFLATFVATVLDSFVQYYLTHKDIFLGHVIEPGDRATAGFKTPNGLGAYLATGIPIIFVWFFKKKEPLRYRLPLIILFFLACWALAVTFSRGAWVAAFLGLLFFVFLDKFLQRRLEFYIIAGFLFLLIVHFLVFGFILTSDKDSPLLRYNTAYWRLSVWEDTLKMIQDGPILGHGINTFMQVFQAYRRDPGTDPTYAHNSYLQIAAETGWVGLVALLWIFGRLFRWFLFSLATHGDKSDNLVLLAMGLLSGILGFLFQSFFDNHFYSLQLSVYLWFLVGLFVATTRRIQWQNSNAH